MWHCLDVVWNRIKILSQLYYYWPWWNEWMMQCGVSWKWWSLLRIHTLCACTKSLRHPRTFTWWWSMWSPETCSTTSFWMDASLKTSLATSSSRYFERIYFLENEHQIWVVSMICKFCDIYGAHEELWFEAGFGYGTSKVWLLFFYAFEYLFLSMNMQGRHVISVISILSSLHPLLLGYETCD